MSLITLVQDKVVYREKVIDEEHFNELMGLALLMPGPVAVNLVSLIGFVVRGPVGAIVSFGSIILPSFVCISILYYFYDLINSLALLKVFKEGVLTIITAVIFFSAVKMARKRMGSNLFPLAAVVLGVLFLKNTFWFIFLLFAACGFIGWIKYKFTKKATKIDFIELNGNLKFAWVPLSIVTLFLVLPVLTWENVFLDMMFTFSKVSITLFGGGYVIIPMLQDIVAQKQWLSTGEFWDAIAISQLCPGPILISSAIVGFKNAGLIGGAVTTLAIFAPAAILIVGIFHSFRNVLKHNSAHFISEGLSMAIIALIFYSAWTTGLALAWDWVTLGLLVLAFFLQSFTKVNSGLLIILGGIAKVTIFYILTL